MKMMNCPYCGGSVMVQKIIGSFVCCTKCLIQLDGAYPSNKAAKRAWNKMVEEFKKAKGETK